MEDRVQEIVAYYRDRPYQTQTKRAYDVLLELIALESLAGEDVITEQKLAQMLQIGRTPLREALKMLEVNHIIKTIPRLGIQVQKIRIEDYYLQSEVRSTLEKLVIRRACGHIDARKRAQLKELNEAFSTTAAQRDRLTLYRVDKAIHALIDDCSKNPYAIHALEPLRFSEERVHYRLGRVYPEIGDELNREHIEYVNAIICGKEENACAHFDNMIADTAKLMQQQLDQLLFIPE